MADSGDFWGLLNNWEIGDVRTGTQAQAQIDDLRDRSAYIAKKTGQQPMSFYEFKMQAPPEEKHTLRNALIGVGLGGLVGLLLLNPIAVIIGAVVGGFIGAAGGTENSKRQNLVSKYSNYIDGFESVVSRQQTVAQSVQQAQTRTDNADRVLAARGQEQGRVIS